MRLPKHDPGPCPVDDCPHTTCVPDASAPTIVVAQTPARDQARTPTSARTYGVVTSTSFTTSEYRRAQLRGRK